MRREDVQSGLRVGIKPMAEEHLNAVAAVERACFGADAWPRRVFVRLLEAYRGSVGVRGELWVAVDERTGRVLGYVGLDANGLGDAELISLAVRSRWRRRGVGRELVSFVIDACRKLDVALLWLRVRRSNAAAVRFYAACGFNVRGEFRAYYDDPREDAIIMAREVPAIE